MERQTGLILAVLSALLSACGGGSSSAPTTYNAQAAYKSFLSAARTLNLAGTASNGSPLSLSWTVAPAGAGTFPLTSVAGQRVDSSIVIRSGATVLASGSQQAYFGADFVGLGSVRADGSCSQSSASAFPVAAEVGQTGTLGVATIYQTCSLAAARLGTITGTWSIEQINMGVYLCSNSTLRDAAGTAVSTESDCIEISPEGTVGTRAVITTNVSGSKVVFAN